MLFAKPQRIKGRGCRVSDRDEAAKVRLGYTDPRSYVRRDGSEVLYGEDWKQRKEELWKRADGRCEYVCPHSRCGSMAVIPAHYPRPRHPRRDDRLTNLKAYCETHDKLMEPQAWRKTRFGER